MLQIFRYLFDDPVPRCARPPAPHHHRSPRSPELYRSPRTDSAKKKWRRHPAAAAPPRRLNQIARVGLLTELGVSAPASRARNHDQAS